MVRDPTAIDDVRVARLGLADQVRLSAFCAECSDFFELVEGQPGGDSTAAELLGALEPPYAAGTRHVWGFEKEGQLVGVAELLQGHPSPLDWYIGLLLLNPAHRRQGLGTKLVDGILNWIRAHGASVVRVVVQHQNPDARTFWERRGFAVEREVVKRLGLLEGPVWVLARQFGPER
jgi:GNAT superfamily N-acetyltransferase